MQMKKARPIEKCKGYVLFYPVFLHKDVTSSPFIAQVIVSAPCPSRPNALGSVCH